MLNLLEFVVKRKELFLKIFFGSLILSYIGIYILVRNQYEASATIIPKEDESSNLMSSMLKGVKGIPLSLAGANVNDQIDLFKTIIYSRTMLEKMVRAFDLIRVYRLDSTDPEYMEKAVKRLTKDIRTKITEESAFVVAVSAYSPAKAAEMTNYLVHSMNERIVELQISRSRDNRIFLESRVQELTKEIRNAEDSLRSYQERTGLLDIKPQIEGILKTHAALETEYAGKELQLNIMKRLYAGNSPQVNDLEIQVQEYKKKLEELRMEGDPGSPLLSLKKLPATSVGFLNLYREVEIDNLVLEYVMPLYEQAKIEEKKDYPILQVVDYAVPPAKRSFPPRVLLSLLMSISICVLVLLAMQVRNQISRVTDPKMLSLMHEINHWHWK